MYIYILLDPLRLFGNICIPPADSLFHQRWSVPPVSYCSYLLWISGRPLVGIVHWILILWTKVGCPHARRFNEANPKGILCYAMLCYMLLYERSSRISYHDSYPFRYQLFLFNIYILY